MKERCFIESRSKIQSDQGRRGRNERGEIGEGECECEVLFFVLSLPNIKGTQAWEIFGLQFWTLYFFIVSYA
jgi:hypothetical protein